MIRLIPDNGDNVEAIDATDRRSSTERDLDAPEDFEQRELEEIEELA